MYNFLFIYQEKPLGLYSFYLLPICHCDQWNSCWS